MKIRLRCKQQKNVIVCLICSSSSAPGACTRIAIGSCGQSLGHRLFNRGSSAAYCNPSAEGKRTDLVYLCVDEIFHFDLICFLSEGRLPEQAERGWVGNNGRIMGRVGETTASSHQHRCRYRIIVVCIVVISGRTLLLHAGRLSARRRRRVSFKFGESKKERTGKSLGKRVEATTEKNNNRRRRRRRRTTRNKYWPQK